MRGAERKGFASETGVHGFPAREYSSSSAAAVEPVRTARAQFAFNNRVARGSPESI
jgi:hypothetical protein